MKTKTLSLYCIFGCGSVTLFHSGIYLCTKCQMSGSYDLQKH